MRASIGIERAEESPRLNHLPQALKAAHCPFFFDEEDRVRLAGRIIHRHSQIPLTAWYPPEVAQKLKTYVYRPIGPRNGETFYVGEGKGNRVFAHKNVGCSLVTIYLLC